MPKKILISGPESTGKSSLTRALADYFDSPFVNEYAREYLDQLHRPYKKEDLNEIAKSQIKMEDLALKTSSELLLIDTDLTVIHIWSQEKYGSTDPWILEEIQKRAYDLYLIPDIDLEWSFDPQRENPNDRERLLKLYQNSFKQRNISYHMVRGEGDERVQNAIEIIKRELNV